MKLDILAYSVSQWHQYYISLYASKEDNFELELGIGESLLGIQTYKHSYIGMYKKWNLYKPKP